MHKKLLFFLFISFTIYSYSQNAIFTGTVIEEDTGLKMADALVSIDKTVFATTTTKNGEFSFNQDIPNGEGLMVTIEKKNYEMQVIFIDIIPGKKVRSTITISPTKEEKKRRKKEAKINNKVTKKSEKAKKAEQKDMIKDVESRDKKLAQEKKKFNKQNKKAERKSGKGGSGTLVTYDDAPEEVKVETVSPLQIRYAEILGITPNEVSNIPLYQFIDEWMGTKYKWGGSSKEGIDCSYFAMKLFNEVNDELIERTAQKQYDSDKTVKWDGRNYLKEGDLLFFRQAGDLSDNIVHVGIYLANNKFVNATEFTGGDGNSGVRIDDLSVRYWQDRLFAAGRRKNY